MTVFGEQPAELGRPEQVARKQDTTRTDITAIHGINTQDKAQDRTGQKIRLATEGKSKGRNKAGKGLMGDGRFGRAAD